MGWRRKHNHNQNMQSEKMMDLETNGLFYYISPAFLTFLCISHLNK